MSRELSEKSFNNFRITLVEKNILPSKIPAEYSVKKVVNTVLENILFDDFPIRGRNGETKKQLRHLLFKPQKKLTKSQKKE